MNLEPPSSILLATQNQGKLREYSAMLSRFPFQLVDLGSFPEVAEIKEVGSTFLENAILKASGYASQTGLLTLADDSGLEVDSLGGAPGVLSARYAGEGVSDAARTTKLLSDLSKTNNIERRARFVCVIAIFDSVTKTLRTFEGKCEGQIDFLPHGKLGFGYDPIFIPDGFEVSFGCLDPTIKHGISHRGRALKAASDYLSQLCGGDA